MIKKCLTVLLLILIVLSFAECMATTIAGKCKKIVNAFEEVWNSEKCDASEHDAFRKTIFQTSDGSQS